MEDEKQLETVKDSRWVASRRNIYLESNWVEQLLCHFVTEVNKVAHSWLIIRQYKFIHIPSFAIAGTTVHKGQIVDLKQNGEDNPFCCNMQAVCPEATNQRDM